MLLARPGWGRRPVPTRARLVECEPCCTVLTVIDGHLAPIGNAAAESGLPLDHEGRLDALLNLYHRHADLWELGGDTAAIELAHDTVVEAMLTTSPDDVPRAELLKAFAHAAVTLLRPDRLSR